MCCIGSMSKKALFARVGRSFVHYPNKKKDPKSTGEFFSSIVFENIFVFLEKNPKFDLDFPYIWKKCLDNDFAFALLSKQGWLKSFFEDHSLASKIVTSSIETNKLFSFSLNKKNKRRVELC